MTKCFVGRENLYLSLFSLVIEDEANEHRIITSIKGFCSEQGFSVFFERIQPYIITSRQKTIIIPIDDIVYLCRKGKNVCFVLSSGEMVQERASLKEVVVRLDDLRFVMIERGYVINLSHVRKVIKDTVLMDNDAVLNMGRARKRGVMDKLYSFMDISPTV